MSMPVYYVDTFTDVPFRGNPTAVCLLAEEHPDSKLHAIARELNLPVTAFVTSPGANGRHAIRYFTVTGEIPACGHATLAAARVMANLFSVAQVVFNTIGDIVIEANIKDDLIYLSYPVYGTTEYLPPASMLLALGVTGYQQSSFCASLETVFIELKDAAQLRSVQPNFEALVRSSETTKEVVITSVSDDPAYDFLLRSFCPWIGIDEDPVTGSVHSVLAHYWQHRTGKSSLKAWQASERGGEVYVRAEEDRVLLGGKTVQMLEGIMNVPIASKRSNTQESQQKY